MRGSSRHQPAEPSLSRHRASSPALRTTTTVSNPMSQLQMLYFLLLISFTIAGEVTITNTDSDTYVSYSHRKDMYHTVDSLSSLLITLLHSSVDTNGTIQAAKHDNTAPLVEMNYAKDSPTESNALLIRIAIQSSEMELIS